MSGHPTDLRRLEFRRRVKRRQGIRALKTNSVRRLTYDGDEGWIILEFLWDLRRDRLFWTESKFVDGARVDLPADAAGELGELGALVGDPQSVNRTLGFDRRR